MFVLRRLLLISCCLLLARVLPAQGDTIYYYEEDTTPKLPPIHFALQTFGAYWTDGRVQFFEGYNHDILYANAISGLPLYSDWFLYSASSIVPSYFQVGVHTGLTDSTRGLRLRLGLQYAQRIDSMAYSGGYLTTDTALGRIATERGAFVGASVAIMKQSRTMLKFLRLHGGADLEVGLSPRSRISAIEYAYDIGDEVLLDYNVFPARGKPRMNVFLNAVVGFETVFGGRFGLTGEIRSGLGTQIVVKQKAFGIARTAYMVGVQYYLWNHNRRPLPPTPHVVEPILEPEELE